MVTDLEPLVTAWVLVAAVLALTWWIAQRRLRRQRVEYEKAVKFRLFSWGIAIGYTLLIMIYAASVITAPWIKAALGLPDA